MSDRPTILDRLQVGGLRPEIVAEFRDRRQKRRPCRCALCQSSGVSEIEIAKRVQGLDR